MNTRASRLFRAELRLSLLLVLGMAIAVPALPADLEITLLANEGVLISSGGGKVLIDALFGEGLPGYRRLSRDERQRLELGQAPFEGVRLVLATHEHEDHFDAAAVRRFLVNNPASIFVSTEEAVARLAGVNGGGATATARTKGVYPAPGERIRLSFPDLELQVLNLPHGVLPIQNLALLLELDGFKVLHVGDTSASLEDVRPYALAGEGIDVALLPYWYLINERWEKVVREEIDPRHILVIHVPEPTAPADYFGAPGSLERLKQRIAEVYPDAIVAEPMTSRVFPKVSVGQD